MARMEASTEDAPAPAGPYSQSVRVGSLVMCSGQVGTDQSGKFADGVSAQTRAALRNVQASLRAQGLDERDIGHVRVYLTSPELFAEMNAAYAEVFSRPYPARTTIFCELAKDALVEIDALAVASDQ